MEFLIYPGSVAMGAYLGWLIHERFNSWQRLFALVLALFIGSMIWGYVVAHGTLPLLTDHHRGWGDRIPASYFAAEFGRQGSALFFIGVFGGAVARFIKDRRDRQISGNFCNKCGSKLQGAERYCEGCTAPLKLPVLSPTINPDPDRDIGGEQKVEHKKFARLRAMDHKKIWKDALYWGVVLFSISFAFISNPQFTSDQFVVFALFFGIFCGTIAIFTTILKRYFFPTQENKLRYIDNFDLNAKISQCITIFLSILVIIPSTLYYFSGNFYYSLGIIAGILLIAIGQNRIFTVRYAGFIAIYAFTFLLFSKNTSDIMAVGYAFATGPLFRLWQLRPPAEGFSFKIGA